MQAKQQKFNTSAFGVPFSYAHKWETGECNLSGFCKRGEVTQDVSVGKQKNSATATLEHVFYRVMPISAEKHRKFVLSIMRNSVEYSSGASQV